MAAIGMKYPVYAPVSEYTEGSAITYGNGAVLCHAISGTITQNRRDNPLYGDDVRVEEDNGMTDYTIEFEGDKITPAERAALLGYVAHTTSSAVDYYRVTDAESPDVGFGYYRVLEENNEKKIDAYWFHSVKFAMETEEANTKGEQIEWGTTRLSGKGKGVIINADEKVDFYDYMQFATESDAKAWLKARANIT